jgi:hypothetical protein
MKRREFMAATAELLAWPLRLQAQGARRRLGFLAMADLEDAVAAGRGRIPPCPEDFSGYGTFRN